MSQGVFARRWLISAATAVAALIVAAPAGAFTFTIDNCRAPSLTQPFLSFGDGNWYTLAPGESANNFLGTGWTLSGGAKIVSTTLYNGTKGYVLDLPPTGKAVSPAVCVTSDYPTARAMIRNGLLGGGVKTSVAYTGFAGWGPAMSTGVIRSPLLAWSLSVPMNIRPSFSPGWQLAQFTFAGTSGLLTDYQIYNFYVDPRMH